MPALLNGFVTMWLQSHMPAILAAATYQYKLFKWKHQWIPQKVSNQA